MALQTEKYSSLQTEKCSSEALDNLRALAQSINKKAQCKTQEIGSISIRMRRSTVPPAEEQKIRTSCLVIRPPTPSILRDYQKGQQKAKDRIVQDLS